VERSDSPARCPACVGPVQALHQDAATTPKALALTVLAALEAA
jgi:DEAD/DEAH box helicase domain-containing protein